MRPSSASLVPSSSSSSMTFNYPRQHQEKRHRGRQQHLHHRDIHRYHIPASTPEYPSSPSLTHTLFFSAPLSRITTSTSSTTTLPFLPFLLLLVTTLSSLPTPAHAYTWAFQSNPQQCTNASINIIGNDGVPPYRVFIIPFGPTPLPNSIEARRITEVPFPGSESSVSWQLRYPANSQMVAVVSDARGFGTGGTSAAAQVSPSSDNSCFDSTTNVQPLFAFSIEPPNQVVQCQPMRIWWDPANVRGPTNFQAIIPGGQSFSIPQSSLTTVPEQGVGFTWVPNVRAGTTLILAGGDSRGNGTAGSVLFVVSGGINNNVTCLSDASPSSTAGQPAGGSYPTGTSGSTPDNNNGNGGGGGGSVVGAVVGGVIGGVALLIAVGLLFFFLRRRSKLHKRQKERPMDLLNEDEDEEEEDHGGRRGREFTSLPPNIQQLTPEPFLVTDPTLGEGEGTGNDQPPPTTPGGRPVSTVSTSYFTRSTTPDGASGGPSALGYGWGGSTTSASRKGAAMKMRPVNIVQHEDAGVPPPPADGGEEPETIELPPAYTAIARAGGAAEGGESGRRANEGPAGGGGGGAAAAAGAGASAGANAAS